MSAHGIELRNGLYPDDGWNMLTMSNIWLDTCAGWGLKADGSSARNEGSYTKLDHVFFQTNGTDATVESVTKANPAVVATTAAHGFANGAIVTIVGAQGMTHLHGNADQGTGCEQGSDQRRHDLEGSASENGPMRLC